MIKFILIITFAIWWLQVANRKRKLKVPKILFFIVLFLALAGLSISWCTNTSSTISSFLTFIQLIIWLNIVVDLLNTEKRIRTAVVFYILGALVVAVMSMILISTGDLKINRAIAFQGQNPNGFAISVGVAFIMLLFSINTGYFFRSNILNILGAILTGLAIILAVSRGTYLALIIPVLLLVFVSGVGHRKFQIFLFFILLYVGFTIFFPSFFQENILPRLMGYESLGGRQTIWIVAAEMIKEHVLLGVGFGNFPDLFGSYSIVLRGWYANSGAHNVYIRVMAELGIVGLLCYVIFQITILRRILLLSNGYRVKYFLLAFLSFLIVSGMSTDLLLDKGYWFGFGLIISFMRLRERENKYVNYSMNSSHLTEAI